MNSNGSTSQHQHEDISIRVHAVDGVQVFDLVGSLDIATSPSVRAALTDASERGDHRLIVDLTRVDFLDSTGLGALIGAQRRAREFHGEVRLVAKEGQILRLLRITGLLKVFAVYSTLEDAAKNGARVGDL
ncbi:MAG: STAS domain-containing protein [Vulcanimicrobiaceae bacterium]|jgi:anti-sigma B factor antagonist